MVNTLLNARTVARLKDIRQHGLNTVPMLWDDTYVLWTTHRPEGTWDDGSQPEDLQAIGGGGGKLYENGAGGPQSDGNVIFADSPYRFRTYATAMDVVPRESGTSEPDVTHLYLVINGTRFFRVDAWKTEDAKDTLGNAYINELFGRVLPVASVVPAPLPAPGGDV